MDTWMDRHEYPHKYFFLVYKEYCLIMESYKQIIIVCYMKLERPFSGFLFAVL